MFGCFCLQGHDLSQQLSHSWILHTVAVIVTESFCFPFLGLLSEEQCKARDVRRKQKSSKSKKHSESNSPESVVSKSDELTDSKEKVKANSCIRPETIIDPEPLLKCNEDTKTLVEKVVFLQDKYEFPDEAVIKSVNVSIYSSNAVTQTGIR